MVIPAYYDRHPHSSVHCHILCGETWQVEVSQGWSQEDTDESEEELCQASLKIREKQWTFIFSFQFAIIIYSPLVGECVFLKVFLMSFVQ